MYGNCCKKKIQNNKKIKFSQKLLDVKESTSVEGPTNCNAATSTTRQCNNNDKYNNNNIKETLAKTTMDYPCLTTRNFTKCKIF